MNALALSLPRKRKVGVAAFSLLGALAAGTLGMRTAKAADPAAGFALDRFEPSEKGSEWFIQDSLDLRGQARPAIGVVGDWGYRPQRLYDDSAGGKVDFVQHQIVAHVGASVVVFDRVRVGAELPIEAYEKGESVVRGGVPIAGPASSSGVGDLRLAIDVRLTGQHGDPFTAAIGARLWSPLGSQSDFTGDGEARVEPHVLIAGDVGKMAYAASLGYLVRGLHGRDALPDKAIGNELKVGGAIGVHLLDRALLIGPEAYVSTVTSEGSSAFLGKFSTYAEATLGVHYTAGDFRIGVGGGPGLANGVGVPAFRTLLSLEYVPAYVPEAPPAPPPPPDRDHDGIADAVDACPDVPGVRTDDPTTNGCPSDRDHDGIVDTLDACPDVAGIKTDDPKTNGCPSDRDHDGIPDTADACPDVAGVATSDPKTNGCPADRDGDGIADAVDACPDVKGVASDDPKKNGCPSDRDGDGIPDSEDACPDHPGPRNDDPKKNGCPAVRIEAGQVRITEQIKFKTGSAEILKESQHIVDDVAALMKEHAEIKKLRVEGHTDSAGNPGRNKELSRRRAAAVVDALVKGGVNRKRLDSAGFGQERPIDTNDTDAGRANNRRVEFHIVDGPGAEVPVAPTKPVKPAPKATTPAKAPAGTKATTPTK